MVGDTLMRSDRLPTHCSADRCAPAWLLPGARERRRALLDCRVSGPASEGGSNRQVEATLVAHVLGVALWRDSTRRLRRVGCCIAMLVKLTTCLSMPRALLGSSHRSTVRATVSPFMGYVVWFEGHCLVE